MSALRSRRSANAMRIAGYVFKLFDQYSNLFKEPAAQEHGEDNMQQESALVHQEELTKSDHRT